MKGVVLDLSETTYLDSRGVQVLLDLIARLHIRQQTAQLVVPERSVLRRLLADLAVMDSVPVAGSVEEALEHIRVKLDGAARPF